MTSQTPAHAPPPDGPTPVDETLRERVLPLTIASGHHAIRDDAGGWLVPKLDLVGVLQILLQSKRIRVAGSLPEATAAGPPDARVGAATNNLSVRS